MTTNDMSKNLDKVKKEVISQSKSFAEHFLKIKFYQNTTNDYIDWLNTLGNILYIVNNETIKPDNRKLKKEWLEENFFKGDLNTINDIKIFLAEFALDGFEDLVDKINDISLQNILSQYEKMSNELLPILSTRNDFSKSDFMILVRKYL